MFKCLVKLLSIVQIPGLAIRWLNFCSSGFHQFETLLFLSLLFLFEFVATNHYAYCCLNNQPKVDTNNGSNNSNVGPTKAVIERNVKTLGQKYQHQESAIDRAFFVEYLNFIVFLPGKRLDWCHVRHNDQAQNIDQIYLEDWVVRKEHQY